MDRDFGEIVLTELSRGKLSFFYGSGQSGYTGVEQLSICTFDKNVLLGRIHASGKAGQPTNNHIDMCKCA